MSIRFKTLHLDKSSADFILFTWNHISLMPSNHSLCISDIWCVFILIEKQNADIDLSNIRRHTYHSWKIELKLHNMILSWHIYSQSILRLCSAKYNIFFHPFAKVKLDHRSLKDVQQKGTNRWDFKFTPGTLGAMQAWRTWLP